ncbi:flagellar hook-basal body complex protein FliE [Paenibacillus sp. PK4536]|uniref:flagellar hook-basal body complex protein FliE n=1 Tax=Paenibacillus TaxID=44249 RepID=UPI0010C1151C|nr:MULTISPECIES: flagellar hook-basal body complex protein FliE [Paenibacillus]TKJ91544.1 flagellar hook-basal body complex protein FliE [Paenibacillus sp. CFBP13512]WIM37774.1 flagellar hook-basal body complex protein FliE [Paenibacillus sp. PK4536]CAJ1315578.1 flagellar hook-basal body complex protein FliE [Paenibacillus nuruki]
MIENTMFNAASPLKMTTGMTTQAKATPGEAMEQFGSYLEDAMNQVGQQEKTVHQMNDKFILGQVDVDQVMVAAEKSLLSLQMVSQVRNKALEAYQEIMRTQL